MSEIVKVRSIVIDTLTAIQQNEFMVDQRKPGHDKWKDYGQSIYTHILTIQQLGFEIIMVLGEPGTGKSSGMHSLPHGTNIWFNTDDKNPVWIGGKTEYGRKNNPTKYHYIPKTYEDIIDTINLVMSKGLFEEERFAFILGHTETYKVGVETKERLKTMGNLATKMQLEGKMETVLYSKVEMINGKPTFVLETQNNGYNTCRSPQSLLEGKIPNDYNLIVTKLLELQ